MRKYFILAATLAFGTAVVVASAPSKAQPYGPGMMGGYGGYGGYGMMGGGYGPGYMMGGYGGNGYGPGMMYGYGPNGERYYGRGGQSYRGQRLCWHQTGADRGQGYYAACKD